MGCREDIQRIAPDGHAVVAVFDDDEVRRLLDIPVDAPAEQVAECIRVQSDGAGQLHVALIEKNIETVIETLIDCDPEEVTAQTARDARGKDRTARDLLFLGASKQAKRAVRDCVIERSPSWKELVEIVIRLLRQPSPESTGKVCNPTGRVIA
ncbi:MAG: hypothetical protein JXR96_10840 [Deltaproteobacteria bacterium]|nr:hypothetical protein [Deltaproteobacteria bacterium]